jgi:hypothetical protein
MHDHYVFNFCNFLKIDNSIEFTTKCIIILYFILNSLFYFFNNDFYLNVNYLISF